MVFSNIDPHSKQEKHLSTGIKTIAGGPLRYCGLPHPKLMHGFERNGATHWLGGVDPIDDGYLGDRHKGGKHQRRQGFSNKKTICFRGLSSSMKIGSEETTQVEI